jgi:hypothetical protein
MHRCRITIRGGLDEAGREAFGDFDIEPNGVDTVLIGELDQPDLRSLHVRVQALGLQIVDLRSDPPTYRSVDTRVGVQTRSEQSVTSDASLAVVHASPDSPQTCSSQWLPAWLPDRHVHRSGGRRPDLAKFATCQARRDRFAFTANVVPRIFRILSFARALTVAVFASCAGQVRRVQAPDVTGTRRARRLRVISTPSPRRLHTPVLTCLTSARSAPWGDQ